MQSQGIHINLHINEYFRFHQQHFSMVNAKVFAARKKENPQRKRLQKTIHRLLAMGGSSSRYSSSRSSSSLCLSSSCQSIHCIKTLSVFLSIFSLHFEYACKGGCCCSVCQWQFNIGVCTSSVHKSINLKMQKGKHCDTDTSYSKLTISSPPHPTADGLSLSMAASNLDGSFPRFYFTDLRYLCGHKEALCAKGMFSLTSPTT